MLSMVWYDCMLTHLQASTLEVSPANRDVSKANNDNAGDAASPAGGQMMKHRKSEATIEGNRALKQGGGKL
jgi:hypothetical protein